MAAVALVLIGPAAALAHEGETHSEPASAEAVKAFATPAPGSYELPPLGQAVDGSVLDSRGRRVRLHDLFGGELVLLSFIYTKCSDAEGCPFATAVLHSVGARLAAEPDLLPRIRLLSLSFDPAHDTPEVMASYGAGFQREGLDWRFLTTTGEPELAPLLAAYRQTRVVERDEQGEETGQFAHLLRVYLIDRQARIRQVYSTSLLEPEALVADVKTLLMETPPRHAPPTRLASLGASGAVAARGSGDVRAGYESADFTTRSAPVGARRGHALDLTARALDPPRGLPPVPYPSNNPITREKVALGRRLFFDRRLSHNDTVSCAMCHVPEQGFTSNEMRTAVGIEGRSVRRNSPTIYNAAYLQRLFHDGRETSLELQIWGPLLAPNEMGNPSIGGLIEKLGRTDDYAAAFEAAFPGRGISMQTLGMALASYERTLVSGSSPFDRFVYGGDEEALSKAARRGLELFTGVAGCARCHPFGGEHAVFTDQGFHNTGVGFEAAMGAAGSQLASASPAGDTLRVQAAPGVYLDVPRNIVAQVSESPAQDLGLYEITLDPADRWRYRTPSLRNVALTAPYMHDGSIANLEDVVEFYRRGGIANEGLDPLLEPLTLRDEDIDALVAFLLSLTGDDVEALVADAFAAPIGDATRPDPSPTPRPASP